MEEPSMNSHEADGDLQNSLHLVLICAIIKEDLLINIIEPRWKSSDDTQKEPDASGSFFCTFFP